MTRELEVAKWNTKALEGDNCQDGKVGKAKEPTVALENLATEFSGNATLRDKGL